MKLTDITSILIATAALLFSSCVQEDRYSVVSYDQETKTIFNITVTRNTKTKSHAEGTKANITGNDNDTKTVSDYSIDVTHANMDSKIAFGLVGIDNVRGIFPVSEELAGYISAHREEFSGRTILVKGSRGIMMEKVLPEL